MKTKNTAKTLYLLFVLILITAISLGLLWIYNSCKNYEEFSADSLVNKTLTELEELSGLELNCNGIPSNDQNGIFSYTVKYKDQDFATIKLKKNGNALIVLALSEIVDVHSLREFRIITYNETQLNLSDKASVNEWQEYEWKELKFLDEFRKNSNDFPKFKQNTVKGLYTAEQIKDLNENIDLIKLDDNSYFILEKSEKEDEIQKRAKEIIDGYSAYIANEKKFYSVSNLFMENSPLAIRLNKFRTDLFTKHSSSEVADLKMSHVYKLSENCVILNAKYDFNVMYNNNLVSDSTELSMLMCLCSDGKWRLGEMSTSLYYNLDEFKDIE